MQNKKYKTEVEQIWLEKCGVPTAPLPSTHLSLSEALL